jgi:hypothetical protein
LWRAVFDGVQTAAAQFHTLGARSSNPVLVFKAGLCSIFRCPVFRLLPCLRLGATRLDSAEIRESPWSPVDVSVFQLSGDLIMKKSVKYLAAILTAFSLFSVVACASTENQTGTGEYLDDSLVTAKVKSAILADADLKVFQINVETFKGTVQLSGFVDTPAAAIKAVEVTRKVSGVKSVKNDIRIK